MAWGGQRFDPAYLHQTETLKTLCFQGFLLLGGTFILPGTFLTRVLTRITKCPKNPICFKRSAVRF